MPLLPGIVKALQYSTGLSMYVATTKGMDLKKRESYVTAWQPGRRSEIF